MPDAIAVLPPGFRLHDGSNTLISGGTIEFYNAGTAVARTVYSDSGLSSSLGSTVYTNSVGVPVASSGSATAVIVYTGASAYKVIIKDGSGSTLITLDNIKGALDTSTFLTTGSTSTLTIPVASKTADYTIVAADRGKVINADASSGTFTLTLTSAVTLGDNWSIFIRNTGTANPVKIAASQTIAGPWASIATTTSFALRLGESALICCNGVSFLIPSMAPALMSSTVGVVEVVDRVSSAPSSPVPGSRYIVSGAFSTFEQEDLIETDGAGSFFEITPPTDCGWVAYVQSENEYYSFETSAWRSRTAVQTAHAGNAKAWAVVTLSGSTVTLSASHNIASITDTGVGDYIVNFTTAFSSANYAAFVMPLISGGTSATHWIITAKAAGSATVKIYTVNVSGANTTLAAADASFSFVAYGAQ